MTTEWRMENENNRRLPINPHNYELIMYVMIFIILYFKVQMFANWNVVREVNDFMPLLHQRLLMGPLATLTPLTKYVLVACVR